MRVLKVFCALVCLSSVARFVAVIHGSTITKHGILVVIWLLIIALVYAFELYGIHTKAGFAWKLGWGILAATFLQFLVLAGSAALKAPETDYPWVAFGAVTVGGSLVALYWGFWWRRQKSYFVLPSPTIPKTGTKELVAVFCILALAFAALTLFSSRTDKYREPADAAVKQFHEQLAAGQYAAIYDEADETLHTATSQSDFVNLLQSVHQKLGNAQDLNLSRTAISFHGGGRMSIRVTYDTKFTNGTATEQFVWQDQDSRVTLGQYQIRSDVLTAK